MLYEKTLSCHLCIVGGGMAGVCAAVAAARQGISVVLLQERPVLGGNASSENRMWICGAKGKNNRETGIIEEIKLENLYRNPTKNYYIFDQILLDFVRREKNITLCLNTACLDASTENGSFADGRTAKIQWVKGYQMTTQTFITVKAKFFADCSGDSILAPLTGAKFRYGRESREEYGEDSHVTEADRAMMGMSCLIYGRETEHPVTYTPSEFVTKLTEEDVKNRPMDLYDPTENFWYLELGGLKDTVRDAEETKDELIPLALGAWDYLKNSGKYGADRWDIDFLGNLPAKRESRRMVGEYTVSQRDISDGTVFPDTVAFGGWPLDDHYPAGYYHKGTPNTDFKTPAPYPLPYRALYSANVENLFFAGRNISMTHTAMSSIRVMATCGLLGQAVGTAAAIGVKHGYTPHEIYRYGLAELQRSLMEQDCFLPYFQRKIADECKKIIPENGDETLHDGQDRPNRIYGTETCGISVKNGVPVTYRPEKSLSIHSVHLVFDSDLNRDTLPGCFNERNHITRANILRTSPQTHLPTTICKAFRLTAKTPKGEVILAEEKNNIKRAHHIFAETEITELSLVMTENHGGGDTTILVSFDFT